MKNRVIFIVKIIAAVAILFTSSYYWLRTVILHIIDHADNNLANGFLGFLVRVVILILIAK